MRRVRAYQWIARRLYAAHQWAWDRADRIERKHLHLHDPIREPNGGP